VNKANSAIGIILLFFAVSVSEDYPEVRRTHPAFPIEATAEKSSSDDSETPVNRTIHDAGKIFTTISYGDLGHSHHHFVDYSDPETGMPMASGIYYPAGSNHIYASYGDLWIGGVVGDDTLVSQGEVWAWWSPYISLFKEFWPDDPGRGGVFRTGRFADDEFRAIYTDTVTVDTLVGRRRYIGGGYGGDSCHVPLGVKVTQDSYSWADSLYDNMIILDYMVENIRGEHISDVWIGFYLEPFITDSNNIDDWWRYDDDNFCGVLDTQLNEDDPDRRTLIAYAFDNDGDPYRDSLWDNSSPRGAISVALLSSSLLDPVQNFNWWGYLPSSGGEYGPRRLGAPEDPFRDFVGESLGEPRIDRDKYYVLSHPEIDFNQMETALYDSSDGWIPCPHPESGYETYCLLSFGPFDLPPGDTISFALSLVVSDNFHVDPGDFRDYFEIANPLPYQARLNFPELMLQHRRADSVYKSSLTLPRPGPPAGLKITGYDNDSVSLAWNRSHHPDVAGYHLLVKDTLYDDRYYHAFPEPIEDTFCVFPVTNPTHVHFLAVNAVEFSGRESLPSAAIEIIPARPHTPQGLTVELDSLTPVLNWQSENDTVFTTYVIYRSAWEDDFEVHDSTLQNRYRDERAESGAKYNYRITARHPCGAESPVSEKVSALPMARDKGILFYDLNLDDSPDFGAYRKDFVDRFYYSIYPSLPVSYYDIEYGQMPFKNMADFELIVFDSEKRGGVFKQELIDSIYNYLAYGGKALFIVPNASSSLPSVMVPRKVTYRAGSFFYDILGLDSVLVNAYVIIDNSFWGDLIGCAATAADFPQLVADSAKMVASHISIYDGLPFSGCIYPRDSVEVLYRYRSCYPDSIFHGQANGLASASDSLKWVFFNFPLSLMEEPANIEAFRRALIRLGLNVACGDVNDDDRLNVGDAVFMIDYLFREGPPPDIHRADVDCDGEINLADALAIINVTFHDFPGLECCPER